MSPSSTVLIMQTRFQSGPFVISLLFLCVGCSRQAALALYEVTVLRALEEMENALVDYGQENARQQFLKASSAASERAVELVYTRYEVGAADFLSVLDAERTLLEAQDRVVASETRTATAFVAIYKALGGGLPLEPSS